jgi:hypothetical protein
MAHHENSHTLFMEGAEQISDLLQEHDLQKISKIRKSVPAKACLLKLRFPEINPKT